MLWKLEERDYITFQQMFSSLIFKYRVTENYRLPALTVKVERKTFWPPCVCAQKGGISCMYIYELIFKTQEDAVFKVPFTAISAQHFEKHGKTKLLCWTGSKISKIPVHNSLWSQIGSRGMIDRMALAIANFCLPTCEIQPRHKFLCWVFLTKIVNAIEWEHQIIPMNK